MVTAKKRFYPAIIATIILYAFSAGAGEIRDASLTEYNLSVTFDIAASRIFGKVLIRAGAGKELILHPGDLEILRAVADGNMIEMTGKERQVIALKTDGFVEIVYEAAFRQSDDNIIDDRGVALMGMWYPMVEGRCIYRLTAVLPAGYNAISEADKIVKNIKGNVTEYHFEFPHPLNDADGISLIASKRFEVSRDSYKGVEIYAYLFPEEAGFAKTFIEYTKRYLKTHEKLLGKFPYKRLSIVEHFEPVGYSMPAYIFLGRENFKLPIEKTPLGHEIVHQWFGNYVYSDYDKGNWNEGFAIYFADHAYDEEHGSGWKCRRRILSNYKSYVKSAQEFPLREFSERYDLASRSIGYGKAAMVVHMLRKMVGDDLFYASIRDFINENKFRVASWDDIRMTFEKKTGKDLAWFFEQWIDKKGTPGLSIEDIRIHKSRKQFSIEFKVVQKNTEFRLSVPVTFHSKNRTITRTFTLEKDRERFGVLLPDLPDEIVLDENLDLFRELAPEEDPPTLARLAGDEKRMVVLPPERKGMYREVIDSFNERGAGLRLAYLTPGYPPRKDHSGNERRRYLQTSMKDHRQGKQFFSKEISEISDDEVQSSSLVVLGKDNPLIERLFGRKDQETDDGSRMHVDIRKNPKNPEKVVVLIAISGNMAERQKAASALEEIFEYPFYSRYSVHDGRVIKELQETPRGVRIKPDYGNFN